MKIQQRPKRFIVIPRHSSPGAATTEGLSVSRMAVARLAGRMAAGTPAAAARATRKAGSLVTTPAPVKVVNRSPADGALLLEPRDHVSIDRIKAQAPQGTKVLEEQWYSLDRPARPWATRSATLKTPRLRIGRTIDWSVTVVLDDGQRRRLPDALVTVMTNEDKSIGVEVKTNRYGKAIVTLSDTTESVDAIYVDPLHSGWPMRVADVLAIPGGVEIAVVPIDLTVPDVRGTVYGKPEAGAGRSVRVAVVDTGVGPHTALKIKRGLNTTTAEAAQRFRDEDGHGSHVAGVIASVATGWRRGEASRVELHAYRIFESGDPYASSFAIASAIKDAATQGCDLVNLSIGDSMADDGIRDAVEFAWARGCVCVAATGNDGKGRVDYPARYTQAVAVSAIGLIGSWPAGAYLEWTLSTSRGIGSRWGVMSGTSMATPLATGVLARRLAATQSVTKMPRDATRSAGIVKLAMQAAEDLRLPARAQGKGLAR